MEDHERPVKICGGQGAHRQKDGGQPRRGPEARPAAQQTGRSEPTLPGKEKQEHQGRRRQDQQHQVQLEQHTHVGKVVPARLRPGEHPHGEVLPQAQAEVQHLIKGLLDLVHRQSGVLGHGHGLNVGVVEGPAQDGHGDGPGQHQHGGGQGGQQRERFAGFQDQSPQVKDSGSPDRAISTCPGR